jgi:hypothetical protein
MMASIDFIKSLKPKLLLSGFGISHNQSALPLLSAIYPSRIVAI